MPVRELIRGLVGVLAALLATLILTLCLAETAPRFGQPQRGIWWLPGESWSKHFSPVWQPVVVNGAINAVVGYMLAGKLTTKRAALFALAGAVVAVALAELLQSPLPRLYGKAGRNTVWFCELFFAFVGAYAGAVLAEKWGPEKRRRKRKTGAGTDQLQ